MPFPYLTLDDTDLTGKVLIIRVDFNSPVDTSPEIPELKGTKRIDDHLDTTVIPTSSTAAPPSSKRT